MTTGVTPSQKKTLLETIRKYFPNAELLFFGSRFSGTHRLQSDLDLCIRTSSPLPLIEWGKLSQALVESDLPFKVDLIDWHRIKPDFQEVILRKCEVW